MERSQIRHPNTPEWRETTIHKIAGKYRVRQNRCRMEMKLVACPRDSDG
jgi:hypothetical protein